MWVRAKAPLNDDEETRGCHSSISFGSRVDAENDIRIEAQRRDDLTADEPRVTPTGYFGQFKEGEVMDRTGQPRFL